MSHEFAYSLLFEVKKATPLSNVMSAVRQFFTGRRYSEAYQDQLNTALIIASSTSDLDHITYLLDSGANAHLRQSCSLYIETSKSVRRNEIMNLLISRGATFHEDDELIMRGVATLGIPFTLQMMLEYGCNIHAMNDYAIKAVAAQNHLKCINLLLIEHNVFIKEETKLWFEENNCTEALEIFAKRDLNNSLELALKPKNESTVKSKKMKI